MVISLPEVGVFTGDSFGMFLPGLQPGNFSSKNFLIYPTMTPTDFDPSAAIEAVCSIAKIALEDTAPSLFPTHFGALHGKEMIQLAAQQLCGDLEYAGEVMAQALSSGVSGDHDQLVRYVSGRLLPHMHARLSALGPLSTARWDLLMTDFALSLQGIVLAIEKQTI
eukprot:GCRY01002720.1.p1 GENE.GCRY01002720.1~~GCRY01002720.1.p1  ORF type:complete len:166 (+),score=25.51 GCRY01002720.1:577-1074(+)